MTMKGQERLDIWLGVMYQATPIIVSSCLLRVTKEVELMQISIK